ncbi:HIT family protein [Actinomadura flavalba]|uniref:HIT family protein n=1 Tax=Actinomadura flavalba TaxID=1120938 RepID=UPI00037B6E1D|nr:HIT family protein [Actinomadura flavalba]
MECLVCARRRSDEWIADDEHWRVAHAFGTSLPGWLVLVPKRHVTAVADLTDAEAAGLGTWQVRLSRALHDATGCAKTYVAQFAEADGFAHVHFHVVPRAAALPAERTGPGVFAYLRDGVEVPARERDEIVRRLRRGLGAL